MTPTEHQKPALSFIYQEYLRFTEDEATKTVAALGSDNTIRYGMFRIEPNNWSVTADEIFANDIRSKYTLTSVNERISQIRACWKTPSPRQY